jgi:large subunit ribosomal protein L23
MAFFGLKKKTEKKPAPQAEAPVREKASSSASVIAVPNVLIRPRVSEKAANMTASNVYTFDVVKTATKRQVREAVKAMYKVTPVKVNVVNTPAKRVRMRRKRGFGATTAGRKAYVYLKKGEEIRFA